MTEMMRAIRITGTGGPEVLSLEDAPAPPLGADEVRVAVRAAGVNRADLLQCLGHYPAPPGAPADIPGLEYAGEVIEVGDRVDTRAPGDRVMGLVGGGAYAEQVVAHARELIPIPSGLDYAEAAAIPEAFVTAFDALYTQGGLGLGTRVVIHAVASGVGTAAVQLVKAAGGVSIGTTRTEDKLEAARALGLDHGVVAEGGRFADAVAKHGPVDLVLELVGGEYVAEDTRCLRTGGRIVLVGLLAGTACTLPLATVLTRRIELRGTVLRSRSIEDKIAVAQTFARHVVPLFERGDLKPVLGARYPMSAAADAHRQMRSNDLIGKIVLEWTTE